MVSFLEANRNWKMDGWREEWMDGWENVTTSEALSTATLNRQQACLEPRPYLWSTKEGWHTHTHALTHNHKMVIVTGKHMPVQTWVHTNLHIDFLLTHAHNHSALRMVQRTVPYMQQCLYADCGGGAVQGADLRSGIRLVFSSRTFTLNRQEEPTEPPTLGWSSVWFRARLSKPMQFMLFYLLWGENAQEYSQLREFEPFLEPS